MSNISLKAIIEGFIFASDKALSVDRIIGFFPEGEEPEKQAVFDALQEIQKDYDGRGIELHEVSTGYRFQVKQAITPWVSRLWEEKPARYTRALLETLALIVYRQPITRGEIEEIRGVSVSSNIIKTLQEREWIRVVGHRDVPGKPALYATTKEFLDYFNLTSLDKLPPLSDIKDLDTIASELDPEKNAELIQAINEMKETEVTAEETPAEELALLEDVAAKSINETSHDIEDEIVEETQLESQADNVVVNENFDHAQQQSTNEEHTIESTDEGFSAEENVAISSVQEDMTTKIVVAEQLQETHDSTDLDENATVDRGDFDETEYDDDDSPVENKATSVS